MGLCTSSGIQNRLWERLIPYNPSTALASVENKSLRGGWPLGAWQLQPWPCPRKPKGCLGHGGERNLPQEEVKPGFMLLETALPMGGCQSPSLAQPI